MFIIIIKWNCDILGVSETHKRETEELYLNGYKFVAQGVEEGKSRSGVGLILSKEAQKAFTGYNFMSDRITPAKFKSMVGELVVIHAPTTEAPQPECDSFYSLLQATISEQKDGAFVILMGDFNAKVECEWENAGGAIGKFGTVDVNDAGERLIQFANVNKLVITNTCFRQDKANRQWTWESPDGFTHNVIDHNSLIINGGDA